MPSSAHGIREICSADGDLAGGHALYRNAREDRHAARARALVITFHQLKGHRMPPPLIRDPFQENCHARPQGRRPVGKSTALHAAKRFRMSDDDLRSAVACKASSCARGMIPWFFTPDQGQKTVGSATFYILRNIKVFADLK